MSVRPGAAFYCMSSREYFLGAVGMINSLRVLGHTEPVFLLDCGLTDSQRDILAPHVTVVRAPSSREPEPFLLKAVAPLANPAEVMVLIDADMVVTRSLEPLIEQAAQERVVAVKDNIDRSVGEWGDLLDLGDVRRQPYVSSGLLFLGGSVGADVLRLMDDRRSRVEFQRSYFADRDPDYPFMYLDQDLLNAILATTIPRDQLVVLDASVAPIPPFKRLRILDEATLRSVDSRGREPYVLHQFVRKPWLEPMYHSPYSRLLARLLLGPDVAVKVSEADVPLRMRRGILALVERWRVNLVDLTRWYVRDVVPDRIRVALRAVRERRLGRR